MGVEVALTLIGFGVTVMAGAVTYLAWRNGKVIRENTEKILMAIRESNESILTSIKTLGDKMDEGFKTLRESDKVILIAMREGFITLGEKMDEGFKTLGEKMDEGFKRIDEGFRLIALLILAETSEEKRRIAEKILSKT